MRGICRSRLLSKRGVHVPEYLRARYTIPNRGTIYNRASGGIGRHVSLRSWCRKAWEFESPLAHKTKKRCPVFREPLSSSSSHIWYPTLWRLLIFMKGEKMVLSYLCEACADGDHAHCEGHSRPPFTEGGIHPDGGRSCTCNCRKPPPRTAGVQTGGLIVPRSRCCNAPIRETKGIVTEICTVCGCGNPPPPTFGR